MGNVGSYCCMAWVLHAMTVAASSNVPPTVQSSAMVMPPETVTPGSMLVVGSVGVTAVPDEAVAGAGSTAGAGSVTTDGCAVVSESSPQATEAANARTMTTARKNRFFTSASFDEDFHLFQ